MQNNNLYDPYSTHIPLLSYILNKSEGDILELGSGYYSTPLINMFASKNRHITTFDNNKEYLNKLKYLQNANHQFIIVEKRWEDYFEIFKSKLWGLIFIDNADFKSGCPKIRGALLTLLSQNAEYIICHDSQNLSCYGYNFEQFKYKVEYDFLVPHTMVVSNFKEIL